MLFRGGRREFGFPAVVADAVGEGVDVVIMSRVLGDSITQWTPYATTMMCSPLAEFGSRGGDAKWHEDRQESDKLLSKDRLL